MPAIDVNQIALYMNIAFAALVGLFAFIGFIRGTFKSIFFFAFTLVILIGGWLMMPTLTNLVLGYDFSFLNLNFNGVTITKFDESINQIINSFFPTFGTLMEQSPDFAFLFNGLIGMIVRIVIFVSIVFLAFSSVGGVVAFILWLLVRPRKKNGRRRKKSIFSRLGGMAVGGLKGALLFFVISFPLAGIASIGSTISGAISSIQSSPTSQFHAVVIDDSMVIVDSVNSEILFSDPLESFSQINDMLELTQVYRNSVAGQMNGLFSANGVKLDEYLFNEVFKIAVDEEGIQLTKEIATVANAYKRLNEVGFFENGVTLSKVLALENDVVKGVIDDLTSLKLINVLIPIGVDLVLYGDDISQISSLKQEFNITSDVTSALSEIDVVYDIRKIGYALADGLSLMQTDTEGNINIDYFNLDPEIVKNIFNSVGGIDTIGVGIPLVVNYLLEQEQYSAMIGQFGIDEVDFDTVNWQNEIRNIGLIHEAIQRLHFYGELDTNTIFGFSSPMTNGSTVNVNIDYSKVVEEDIKNLAQSLVNSTLLTKAMTSVVVSSYQEVLPSEYSSFFYIESMEQIDWSDNETAVREFTSLLYFFYESARAADVLSLPKENFNFDNIYGPLLENADLDKLSYYLSQSQLLTGDLVPVYNEESQIVNMTSNINSLFKTMLQQLFPDLPSSYAEGKVYDWSEENIRSSLYASRIIVQMGLIESDFLLTDVTNDQIEELAFYMIRSDVFKSILNKLIQFVSVDISMSTPLALMEEDEWNQDEIEYFFKAVKLLQSKFETYPNLESAFMSLNTTELTECIKSTVFRNTLVNFVKNAAGTSGALYDIIIVSNVSDSDWEYIDEDNTGELTKFFEGLRIMMGGVSTFEQMQDHLDTINIVSNLNDDDLDVIFESIILRDSIVHQVNKQATGVQAIIVIPDGIDLTDTARGSELRKLLLSVNLITGGAALPTPSEIIDNVLSLTDPELDQLVASGVISATIINKLYNYRYTLATPDNVLYIPFEENDSLWDTELKKLLKAIILVSEGTISGIDGNGDAVADRVLSYDDVEIDILEDSEVMFLSIVNRIIIAGESNSYLNIRYDINDPIWRPDGGRELRFLIKAINKMLDDTVNRTISEISISGVQNLQENKETLLMSRIISESIVEELVNQSLLNPLLRIPDDLYNAGDYLDVEDWYNLYDTEYLISYEGEASKAIGGFDELIGDGNIVDAINLFLGNQMTVILGKDFEILVDSRIVENSVVYQVESVIGVGGSMENYVVSPAHEEWYREYILEVLEEGELLPFLQALKMLQDAGVSYQDITFDSLKDSDIDGVEAALLHSDVLENSLNKMISRVLTDTGDSRYDNAIDRINDPLDPVAWGEMPVYTVVNLYPDVVLNEYTELYLLLKAMTDASDLDSLVGFEDIDTLIERDDLANLLHNLNKSSVLRPILQTSIKEKFDENLVPGENSWMVTDEVEDATDEDWKSEIDLITNLLYTTNTNGISISNPIDPLDDAISLTVLEGILYNINDSFLLDINQIRHAMLSGLNGFFGPNFSIDDVGDEDNVILVQGIVDPHDAWEAEIADLILIIGELRTFGTTSHDLSAVDWSSETQTNQLGDIFNAMAATGTLKPSMQIVIDSTIDNVEALLGIPSIDPYVPDPAIFIVEDTTNYRDITDVIRDAYIAITTP